MKPEPPPQPQPQAPLAKKPYEKPTLECYGDICEIARTVGLSGMSDGGLFGLVRTR